MISSCHACSGLHLAQWGFCTSGEREPPAAGGWCALMVKPGFLAGALLASEAGQFFNVQDCPAHGKTLEAPGSTH